MAAKITLVAILIFSMVIPFLGYVLGNRKEKSFKASLAVNLVLFFGTVVVADMLLFSGHIYAASDTAASAAEGWRYMAAALSTGLSCIGAGVAVASAASAAIGALSEDSSIMGKALIFVAGRIYRIVWTFDLIFHSGIKETGRMADFHEDVFDQR